MTSETLAFVDSIKASSVLSRPSAAAIIMGQKRSQHRFAISLGIIQVLLAIFYGVFVRYGGSADAINYKDHKDDWQEMAITYPCKTNL